MYILSLLLLFAGCRLIDDDLSVCGTDYVLSYEMKLVTDIQMTIDERLSMDIEQTTADTLKKWLAPIFSGSAHDLDMSFYSQDGQDELRYHTYDTVDAQQKTYTLYIPLEDYMHLAVVNTSENGQISIRGGAHSASMRLEQTDRDTIASHGTAVYTARLPMHITQKDTTQLFDVRLYMVSSAVALVIDSLAFAPPEMRVLLSGTASGFAVRDSIFTFEHPSLVRAERVSDHCYVMVSLPSADSIAATGMPARRHIAADEAPSLWQLRSYITLPDGRVTETLLSVDTPLKAGMLEIIKVNLQQDGSLLPVQTAHVGVSVTLDWKQGGEHEIDI